MPEPAKPSPLLSQAALATDATRPDTVIYVLEPNVDFDSYCEGNSDQNGSNSRNHDAVLNHGRALIGP